MLVYGHLKSYYIFVLWLLLGFLADTGCIYALFPLLKDAYVHLFFSSIALSVRGVNRSLSGAWIVGFGLCDLLLEWISLLFEALHILSGSLEAFRNNVSTVLGFCNSVLGF